MPFEDFEDLLSAHFVEPVKSTKNLKKCRFVHFYETHFLSIKHPRHSMYGIYVHICLHCMVMVQREKKTSALPSFVSLGPRRYVRPHLSPSLRSRGEVMANRRGHRPSRERRVWTTREECGRRGQIRGDKAQV